MFLDGHGDLWLVDGMGVGDDGVDYFTWVRGNRLREFGDEEGWYAVGLPNFGVGG